MLFSPATGRGLIMDTFKKRLYSMRRRIFAWAELVKEYQVKHDTRLVMITLTYRVAEDWQSGHIREFVKAMKFRLGDRCLAFAWVAELQKRGAVHYHMMLLVPKGTLLDQPDTFWDWGMTRIETARTPFYLVSYSSKSYQKDVSRYPRSCRTYAASIRFGGKGMAGRFHDLSMAKRERDEGDISDWQVRGFAVTEGYAKTIMPLGADVI